MKKQARRTPQQQIADLQARIAEIQQRAERKKLMKDPAVRHVTAALRSIERALADTRDAGMRQTLSEARKVLTNGGSLSTAVLVPAGPGGRASRRAASTAKADPADILRYLKANPGSRAEDIATGLETETASVSPVLKALKDDGKARTEGQARGTRYFVGR